MINLELERALSRITMIKGKGDRHNARLCVMSLVAALNGDKHTDSPSCASKLITLYAVQLNDTISAPKRQTLKAFAPRIVGTRDGRDDERRKLLVAALEEMKTLLIGQPISSVRRQKICGCINAMQQQEAALGDFLPSEFMRLFRKVYQSSRNPAVKEAMADFGIGLLDRFCAVGETDKEADTLLNLLRERVPVIA
jgi:hypothetical protein